MKKMRCLSIPLEIIESAAFNDLKPRVRLLLLYAFKKMQEDPLETGVMYFDYKLLIEEYKLYHTHNKAELFKDRITLAEHGFIRIIAQEDNQKYVYQMIDEWKKWAPGMKYQRQEKTFFYMLEWEAEDEQV